MKNINIRDSRGKEWFWVDNDFIDKATKVLTPAAVSVYLSLCRHSKNDSQECYPSMRLMAGEMGIGKTTVVRATKLLEQLGLISIIRSKKEDGTQSNNVYVLLSKRNWRLKPGDTTGTGAGFHLSTLPGSIPGMGVVPPQVHNNTHINKTQLTTLRGFDEFWSLYPCKKAKVVAQTSWSKIDPSLHAVILADVEKRKLNDRQWQNPIYIPHPSTYLNQKRWTDDITPATSNATNFALGEKYTKGKFEGMGKEIKN